MSLVSADIAAAFESAELGGAKLEDGNYVGTIRSLKVEEGKMYGRDAVVLKGSVGNEEGMAFFDIELSPLTDKEGNLSAGKVKFLKWQLDAMGFKGSIEDLEFHLANLIDNEVDFEVRSKVSAKINEKTGQPYINTDTVIKNFIGGQVVEKSATPVAGNDTPIY